MRQDILGYVLFFVSAIFTLVTARPAYGLFSRHKDDARACAQVREMCVWDLLLKHFAKGRWGSRRPVIRTPHHAAGRWAHVSA
jgi:hypothetical protein